MFRSSLIEDFLFAQPMNVAVRLERFRAHRVGTPGPGTTIVIVNFNTLDILQTTISAIRRFTAPEVPVIVVDNGSRDGSRAWLADRPEGIRPVLLRTNLGHGRALDIGICRSSTTRVLLLDSDAFPVAPGWLDVLEEPMISHGLRAVGMRGRRDRLHPACALIDRGYYLDLGLSMAVHSRPLRPGEERTLGVNAWDCAELFSLSLSPNEVKLIDTTPTSHGGEMMGGCVYHHAGLTVLAEGNDVLATPHKERWAAAVAEYLGA